MESESDLLDTLSELPHISFFGGLSRKKKQCNAVFVFVRIVVTSAC